MLRTTLRQFEIFVAITRTGTVTEAAEATGLTQSAASMALAELERQIGRKLFDRASKRLILNENGRILYPRAVELIDRALELEGGFERGEHAANLHLGASSTIGNYMLPQLIARFSAINPGSSIRLEVNNTHVIIDEIKQFRIDIGFIEGPCWESEIKSTLWKEDELVICAAPSHPLAKQDKVTAEDLLNANWILREEGSGTREVVENILETQLGIIQSRMEVGGTEAIKRTVECGLGISCLPKIAITGTLERGTLICLQTPFLRLVRHLNILIHKEKFHTSGIKNFLSFCALD